MKKITLFITTMLVATTVIFFACQKDATKSLSSSSVSNAKGGGSAGAYDPVTLTCADGATQHSLSITVTAGASGAPAGFSIQWMTKAQFDAIGDVWPTDTTSYCKASFSGVPYGSKNAAQAGTTNIYNLPSNGSVTVVIGDLLDDQLNQALGYSTSTCAAVDGLDCGTQYVFRAFAHANSTKNRSAYSFLTDACATTAPCGDCGRQGYGYWKTNLDATNALMGDAGMTIGGHAYSTAEIDALLAAIPQGNGYITLAHHLITANLNNLNTAANNGTCFINVSQADAAFNGIVLVPTSGGKYTPTTTEATLHGLIASMQGKNNSCDCDGN